MLFEHHTFLHHSQTVTKKMRDPSSLSTIHFYIILKLACPRPKKKDGLSTIHFYIILKPPPTVFKIYVRLSTIHFYIILKQKRLYRLACSVWAPYISTSFSNTLLQCKILLQFEHHTFLHHSQTYCAKEILLVTFEHHTFLHHSQTDLK